MQLPKFAPLVLALTLIVFTGGGSSHPVDKVGIQLPKPKTIIKTLPVLEVASVQHLGIMAPPNPCGDNPDKQYIYQHESGCKTTAVNWIGCKGLGQSCPASKIAQCGDDWFCQDKWFSDYANRAYGGWAQAAAFWRSHRWW